jgi:E-phenylitaconyl-CoA hydratase
MAWVTYEVKDQIATITMNRPDRLNAWGKELSDELAETFARYKNDDSARVAILRGAGRSFCAGADFKEYRENQKHWSQSPQDELGVFGRGELFKPVIGAIQGHCLGAGLLLIAMRCDIRIASEDALFGLPEVAVGIVNCEVPIANQSIPLCVLMEMTMTADPIDSDRALKTGLVNKVVPTASLMLEAMAMAKRISRNSPMAIQLSKQNLLNAVAISDEAKKFESRLFQMSSSSLEAIEGFSSVAMKKAPNTR